MKYLVADEISMVSSNIRQILIQGFEKIYMMIPEKAFPGYSVMTVVYIFSQFSDKDGMKHLLGFQL